jgi:hypothetical protein
MAEWELEDPLPLPEPSTEKNEVGWLNKASCILTTIKIYIDK